MTKIRLRTKSVTTAITALMSVLLLVFGLTVALSVSARTAKADSAPAPGTPATVTADELPTVQINGVVWSQVTVGNTVYATGNFTQTRPAGAAPGTNLTARSYLLAYDITTGNLITSFNHVLNSQGEVVSASPDGSTVYVGGYFTKVDGAAHAGIAAFSTATGKLISTFAPQANGEVSAIAATNSTVYFGGHFSAVNGNARGNLAAAASGTGALLGWAPTADDNAVNAMVMAPDGSRVIVGGSFGTLNGVPAYGLGALDPVSGATLPFAADQSIQDYGQPGNTQAAILSLTTDGTQVYGSGFSYGQGDLEGTFAANPDTGAINLVNDCHGDTYSTFVSGQVLYSVGHAHDCTPIGAFPDSLYPRLWHRAIAETTYPTGTDTGPDDYGWNYNGDPDSTLLSWGPDMTMGTFTGQGQAAWSVTGNSGYVALGGEFPSVNGVAQQGLVRFAMSSSAPNKAGPRPSTALTPHAASLSSGSITLSWQGTYDYDNQALTYKLVRDSKTATPIYTTTVNSSFYSIPSMSFTDTGLTPGSVHSYRVYVYDAFGNMMDGSTITATATPAQSTYAGDVIGDGAIDYWRLGESSGTTATDSNGYLPLTEGSGITDGATGAIIGDSNTAANFNGTSSSVAVAQTQNPASTTFTEEAWINTTSTTGGEILSYGNNNTSPSDNYDRMIYMDNAGQLLAGTYNNATGFQILSTPKAYNDGQWHQVVATMSSAGTALYVDGTRIGTNAAATTAQKYYGYWHIGGDNLGGWPAQPSSNYFTGSIDEVSIYPTALTYAQVQTQFTDSGRILNIPAPPADAYGATVYNSNPSLYWRLDDASGPTAADASGTGNVGTYSGGVTYQTPSPVTGSTGTGVTLDGSSGGISTQTPVQAPTSYTEELWFNTTTTAGGWLIGFGNQSSGLSSSYDSQIYMLNSGQLSFGAYNGATPTATSPASYNDGKWHQVVAAQGSDGMNLYVDGALVATNPNTVDQSFYGYWRVGGDNLNFWPNQPSSDYFAGSIDEVAVFSSELPAATVLAQYQASPSSVIPNQPPVAAFTPSCTALTCSFDGSASHDPDGTIASYSWNFGDGSAAGTGVNPAHAYPAAGVYPVVLTVTDNSGASTSITGSVTATAPPNPAPTVLANDTFARTVTGGLGTANIGGAWTTAGLASNLSVANGSAILSLPTATSQVGAALRSVSSTSDETDVTWASNVKGTGTGIYLYLAGRRVTTNQEYDARVHLLSNNTIGLSITKLNGNATAVVIAPEIVLPGITYTPGAAINVRFQVSGTSPTSLKAMAWLASGTQPTTWQVSTTDSSTGIQAAGAVGLTAYLAGTATNAPVTISASNFSSTTLGAPTAVANATCSGLNCSADGTGSSDPSGTISSWVWSWGDGVVTTGSTSTHTYAAGGTYVVTLTVTDPSGLTAVTTSTVTVPA